MLSHVHVGITDFDRALAFYSGVMGELGFPLKFSEPTKPWAGWMPAAAGRPLFFIGAPHNGEGTEPGNGQKVTLLAPPGHAGLPRRPGPTLPRGGARTVRER